MGKKAAREATAEFLKTAKGELKLEPSTRNDRDGLSFVAAHLNETHMQAALWLQKKHAMRIDAANLGNLITVWKNALSVSAVSAKHPRALLFMVVDRVIAEGEFHPAHLIRYFKKNRIPGPTMPVCSPFSPTIH